MPIVIDPGTQAQAQAAFTRSALLFEFYLTTTQYFTNCDRPLLYGGNTYYPFPIQIGEIKKSSVGLTDDVTLVLSNVTREISALLLSESFAGKRAVIRRVFLSDDYTITVPFIVFDGLMDDITAKEEATTAIITVTLRTDLAYWQKSLPGRQYQATCAWAFKSAGCGYVGAETWCNRTWERCKALANQSRFSGFRHLPKLESSPLWWGKTAPDIPQTDQHVGIQRYRA
ncbi:MAG: DUF2163 domain-containing protein [Deltaproteobacteria bacterium]|nr:DUF2163 domain-containing protein [Deltaproteobacteria bacterium]